jgi:flagellar basal body-associated protein FliL
MVDVYSNQPKCSRNNLHVIIMLVVMVVAVVAAAAASAKHVLNLITGG